MEDLNSLLRQAASGDTGAYDQIVSRFRDMAYSYAYSVLRDFHLAEDATQEAFLQAFYDLPKLREPRAFPGWLRRIVFKQCDRLTRRRRVPVVPLEEAVEVPARGAGPEERAEVAESHAAVLSVIGALPDREREVVLLCYIRDYSQREVADFLQVPATTVNSRLQQARKRLKGMMTMVERTLKEYQLPEDFRVTIKRASATQTAAPGLTWFQGRWVMAWQDGVRGDPWDHPFWFFVSESADGKQWSEPRRLDLPPQLQQLPRLCVWRDELVMHIHDWHHGVRLARTRDLHQWSDVRLALGDTGRGGLLAQGDSLYLAYARWCEIDSIGDAVEVMTSTDGATWRWLTSALPGRGTGVLSAFGLATVDRLYAFWSEQAHPEGVAPEDCDGETYVNWSEDGGATWSAPTKIETLSAPLATPNQVTSPGAASLAPDGRLVIGYGVRDAQGKSSLWLALSRDRGQTWAERAVIPIGALEEAVFAFSPEGTLLIAGSSSEGESQRPVVLHSRLQP